MKTSRKGWGLSSGFRAFLVVLLFSIFCPHRSVAQPSRLGDLDGDGVPTVIDLQRLLNHINAGRDAFHRVPNLNPVPDQSLPIPLRGYADVNGDGYINQADVDLLAQAILGTPITTQPRPIVAEPASGASEVGVTVRPRVYFPKPIIPATLNSNNFYASFAGRKLPARIVPANDGTFAWLFLDPPMPGASQVQVTVDGSTISVISGEILDADADLAPGGVFRFNFSTVSVAGIPGTVLSSRIVDPGPDLIPRTVDDVVLAAGYQYLLPIAGVKVHVLGLESNFAYTDANGRFTLTNMPVGNVKVVLDGRTATSPPAGYYFPEMVMDTTLEPGITNGVMNIVDTNGVVVRDANGVPIRALAMYLPRVASNVLQTVSATNTTMITLQSNAAYTLSPTQQQYLTVEIMPGSLIGLDGQPMSSGQVGISVVPPELVRDMLPPGLLQHTFDITIQAPGISTFSTPAPMTFPNVFNAPPGTKLNFLSFDHTTGRLVIEGTATVSADGLYVTTDPGTGITHPGWHGLAPPGGPGGPPPPPPPPPCTPNPEKIQCLKDAGVDYGACVAVVVAGCVAGGPGYPVCIAVGVAGCTAIFAIQVNRCDRLPNCVASSPAPAARAAAALGGMADPVADQLVVLVHQQIYLAYPYVINGEAMPLSVENQIKDLDNEMNALAGGDAVAYLRNLQLQAERENAGIEEWMGNAPANPLDYVAHIQNTDGTSFLLRRRTEGYGQYSIFIPAGGTVLSLTLYDPITDSVGFVTSRILPEARYRFPRVELIPVKDKFPDNDHDGLADVVEIVYGTSTHNADTDGDGVSDLAEVQQHLDPLNGRPVATGILAALPLPGEAKEVVLEGSTLNSGQQTAYVALGSRGLGIADASQFQRPILLGQLDLPGDATDVSVDSSLRIAVVAANGGGLHFVNVADPMNPVLLQTLAVNASQVEVISGIAYVAAGNQISAYDLLTRQLVQTISPGGATITGLANEGLFLYTMDANRVLRAIDLSDSGFMAPRGSLTMPAGGGKLFVGNGIAYVAAGDGGNTGGFATVDVSDLDAPRLISGVDAANVEGQAVVPNGSGLAVAVGTLGVFGGADARAIDVLDVRDPANTGVFRFRYFFTAPPLSVAIGAGIAFVADGTAGLQVVNYLSFDNSNRPPTIRLTNSFALTTPTNGLAEEGKLVRVAAVCTDDVQVRDVEFYVDDVKVFTDVTFPFEHRFLTPRLSAGKTNFTVRAKATDTGGNSTWSDEITVQLAPDLTPPRVVQVIPERNSVASTNASAVLVFFSEPMDAASITPARFRLLNAGPDFEPGTGGRFRGVQRHLDNS